jgi:hypothetical protein
VADYLWTTRAEVRAAWAFSARRQRQLVESSPSVQPLESGFQRRSVCEHAERRPADVCQPAIELFESASLALYR